jgi:UDP:flavonoid glycosyltransferase YjiC (YdhE family)
VHQGAGVRLRPTVSVSRIGRAVDDVLGDERFAAEVRRLASVIRREQEQVDVVAELEALATADHATTEHDPAGTTEREQW